MKRYVSADHLFFVWILLAFVLAWQFSPASDQTLHVVAQTS